MDGFVYSGLFYDNEAFHFVLIPLLTFSLAHRLPDEGKAYDCQGQS